MLSSNILGTKLTGDNQRLFDSNDDMHVNMEDNEKLEKFDDNVNSASCICVTSQLEQL